LWGSFVIRKDDEEVEMSTEHTITAHETVQIQRAVPTLVMHGEDDQIVPVQDSAKKSARLIKGAAEVSYPGLPHGFTATHTDHVSRDLLAFCQKRKQKAA
jgi:pimeloyl-ACP methyl ester carboxylesterase